MYSIYEVRNVNKNYEKEVKRLNELNENVRKINDNLDLEEVKSKLSYIEAKELYKLILSRNSNKERCEELKKIVEGKKSEEYPQINDVHYYPVIGTIEFLTKEQKIKLDNLIKDAYKNRRAKAELRNLDSKIKKFLVDNSIIETLYIFHCNCRSIECGDTMISQKKFDKLKDYWENDKKGLTTHEEDEEMRYGCFEIDCFNDGAVEICSLDDFNEHLRQIEYRVIVAPDLFLDKI